MDYILLYGYRAVGIFPKICAQLNYYIDRYNLNKIDNGTIDSYKRFISDNYKYELLFALYLDNVEHMKIDYLYCLDDDQKIDPDWLKA